MFSEFNAMSDEERREFINQAYIIGTTEDATQTDLVGEQHDDGRVEAGDKSNPWCPKTYGQAPKIAGDGNYSP